MSEYKIKETKELLDLLLKGVKIAIQAKQNDGKYTVGDIGLFSAVLPGVMSAFDGITDIPKELGDLDSQEALELQKMVVDTLEEIDMARAAVILTEIFKIVQSSIKIYAVAKKKDKV